MFEGGVGWREGNRVANRVIGRLAELLGSRRGLQSTEQGMCASCRLGSGGALMGWTELVDAVRASLRRKVEALAEDEWVFEGESSKM